MQQNVDEADAEVTGGGSGEVSTGREEPGGRVIGEVPGEEERFWLVIGKYPFYCRFAKGVNRLPPPIRFWVDAIVLTGAFNLARKFTQSTTILLSPLISNIVLLVNLDRIVMPE